jgi:uncharacterized protein
VKRYLVTVMRTPDFDAGLVDAHRAFLADLQAKGWLEMAGPFTDQSGGAYLLHAESLDQARGIAFDDPLHVAGASKVSVYEWSTG